MDYIWNQEDEMDVEEDGDSETLGDEFEEDEPTDDGMGDEGNE